MLRRAVPFLLLGSILAPAAVPASAAEIAVEQGGRIVRLHCSGCHAVGRTGASPLPVAPPFRQIARRYPLESLEEALVEGIVTGHDSMPEFRFEPDQASDIIAYLKTLGR